MSESDDESGKTEEPTQHKLDEARKKGEVPTSREINHWFMFLAAALFLFIFSGSTATNLTLSLQVFIDHSYDLAASNPGDVGSILWQGLIVLTKAVVLPFLIFFIAAAAGTLLQIGPMWAPDHLMPKLERISFLQGVGRLFSRRSVMEFLKGLTKLTVVGVLVLWLMWPALPALEHLLDATPITMLNETWLLALRVLGGAVALMMIVAILDYLIQRLMFMQKMRMSKTELKEEYKRSEGDPQIKQRIRQIRMERARQRMMSDVPKADVIITNPEHYAVALKYDPKVNVAPVVVAMGLDLIAQKIKEIAKEHKIPIVENPPLARALYASSKIDQEIPTDHYRAVAEVISYIFKLKNKSMPNRSR